MSEGTVYLVGFDVERYQSFLYDLPEAEIGLELWQFDGRSRRQSWTSQPVYVDDLRLERPDIWHLVGAEVLVMTPEVIQLLEPFVSQAGELLPLHVTESGEEVFALNVLDVVNCLAPDAGSLDALELYPRFLEHRLPETGLFKVPPLAAADTFYVERDDDEDSFRQRIERHQLRGLDFSPVWSSSTGPADINLFQARI